MRKILRQPYPCPDDPLKKLLQSVVFGAFVFLFLLFFQPFGLQYLPQNQLIYATLGFGLITLSIMLFNGFLVPLLFPHFFTDRRWTLGTELLWVLWHIFLIGSANLLYSWYHGYIELTAKGFMIFQLFTIGVGIWPVAAFVMINQMRLMRKNLNQALVLSRQIEMQPLREHHEWVILTDENGQEKLRLNANQLLFIRSFENYNEINYLEKEEPSKQLMRGTLKSMEAALQNHPEFYRCHRSYIVNLEKINHVSGNSQGLKLHFPEISETIPVARAQVSEIRRKLE